MKFRLTLLILLIFAQLNAQTGLDKSEMRDMIAICNSFTFIDLYKSDKNIIPKDYHKVYTSGVFGMDNKFQIYKKNHTAVIHFRGSTDKQVSWLENIYAAMIPAQGVINLEGEDFPYHFADDTSAAVHSGYSLGLAFMHAELIDRIKILNDDGIYDIIITGHSQGGSLANLATAVALV